MESVECLCGNAKFHMDVKEGMGWRSDLNVPGRH